MKLLLALLLCFITSAAFAQIRSEDIIKRLESANSNQFKKLESRKLVFTPKPSNITKTETPFKTEPGVYFLQQDGMPCLVPDVASIAAIPNVFSNVVVPFKPSIPNAAPLQPLLLPNKK